MEDLDALHLKGFQLLQRFQQEMEHFRRPSLIKPGGALAELAATARSPGLMAYEEAGCRKSDEDRSLVTRLNTTLCELQEQVSKNATFLSEMQRVQEAWEERVLDSLAPSTPCKDFEDAEVADSVSSEVLYASEADKVSSSCYERNVLDSGHVTMGRALLAMYERDVEMKAKIIGDLRLDTPSHLLQAYSIMWNLRPYISDDALEECKGWAGSAG